MNERHQTMARLYVEEGLTYEQIGKRYGITRQRVGQILGPLAIAKHQGARYFAERLQELRATQARINSGESTLKDEAQRLGYAKGEYLRSAFSRYGLRIRVPPPPEPEHGTTHRYQRGCKCGECRRAIREYNANLRGKGEAPNHGTESGYRNYGCRCPECREAARVADRERRAQRRKEKEAVV